MGGTICSESNHLSPNDFFSLLAYGILRILKIYTAYCLINHHHPCMQNAIPPKGKFSLCANIIRMKCYSILSIQAKQWVQLFLSIKEEGHQKKLLTCMQCPKPIRKFETIFMSRLVMHCTSFLIVIYALQVLRNTTMMQKETTSLAIYGMHQLTL